MNAVQTNVLNTVLKSSVEGKELPSNKGHMFTSLLHKRMTSENKTLEKDIVKTEEFFEEQVLSEVDSEEELLELTEEMKHLQRSNEIVRIEIEDIGKLDDGNVLQQLLEESTLSPQELHHLRNMVTDMLRNSDDGQRLNAPENATRIELSNIMIEIQVVVQRLLGGDSKVEVASTSLLSLLKSWSALTKQMDNTTFQQVVTKILPKETNEMMEKLIERYEKRHHFSAKKMYGQDAEVTSKDVVRWIMDILPQEKQLQIERTTPLRNNDQISAPRISVVEQHVIHVSNGERVDRVQQELTQQITNLVQQQKFGKPGNLIQELSITLKPEHLGTMTIKFTQENNEIMVKIITTSSMTRDLLEGNMQQLKHAFSPHQVQVVREDTIIDEEIIATNKEETNSEEHEEKEKEQLNEQDDTEQEAVDFAALFKQLKEEGDIAYD